MVPWLGLKAISNRLKSTVFYIMSSDCLTRSRPARRRARVFGSFSLTVGSLTFLERRRRHAPWTRRVPRLYVASPLSSLVSCDPITDGKSKDDDVVSALHTNSFFFIILPRPASTDFRSHRRRQQKKEPGDYCCLLAARTCLPPYTPGFHCLLGSRRRPLRSLACLLAHTSPPSPSCEDETGNDRHDR